MVDPLDYATPPPKRPTKSKLPKWAVVSFVVFVLLLVILFFIVVLNLPAIFGSPWQD